MILDLKPVFHTLMENQRTSSLSLCMYVIVTAMIVENTGHSRKTGLKCVSQAAMSDHTNAYNCTSV